jgi:hypothetical protein
MTMVYVQIVEGGNYLKIKSRERNSNNLSFNEYAL